MKRSSAGSFQDFYRLLQTVHQIPRVDVLLGYTDIHGDLLPINNDDNYHKALSSANPLLRVIIQKKGKGAGSILPIKGNELCPMVSPIPCLGCDCGGGSWSPQPLLGVQIWRWWHREGPRAPRGWSTTQAFSGSPSLWWGAPTSVQPCAPQQAKANLCSSPL